MSEESIRALHERGDAAGAATEIIRSFGPRMLRYFLSIVRDDDAAQDTFALFAEHVWRGIDGFKGESSYLTWTYAVAWRAAERTLRDPYRRRKRALPDGEISQLVDEVRASTAAYLRTEVRAGVARLRESLDPEARTLLYLRIDQDLPWRQVAEILAMEEPALRKRFERIVDKLRKLAKQEGLLGV